jgi:predicted transcriptional regulator
LKDSGVLCNIAVDNVEKTRSGAKLTEVHIALLRKSNIGKKLSEESIKKMSEAQKTYSLTDEGRARIARNRELRSRKVSIEGIDYSSISEASRLLKIPYTSLVRRYGL